MKENQEEPLQALFARITHLYFCEGVRMLRAMDVHPKQVPILYFLRENKGLSQNEISKRMNIKPPTVAVSIKRLEKRGIIERRPDETDHRISRVYLTPKGLKLSEDVRKRIDQSENVMFKGFSEAELCLMRRFFNQIIENFKVTDEN